MINILMHKKTGNARELKKKTHHKLKLSFYRYGIIPHALRKQLSL